MITQLERMKDFFGDRIDEANINISFDLPKEHVFVKGIPASIEHAMFNIVHNAIDAVEQSELKNVALELKVDNRKAYVKVKDTGMGIPEEIAFRIYDPFFTTKEIGRGVGLGLSVARTYLEDHGANIDVESLENEGTTFTITLPVEEAA